MVEAAAALGGVSVQAGCGPWSVVARRHCLEACKAMNVVVSSERVRRNGGEPASVGGAV